MDPRSPTCISPAFEPHCQYHFLPQYGFGKGSVDFETLSKDNRYLFRVYTPKLRSPIEESLSAEDAAGREGGKVFFLAQKFDNKYNPAALPLTDLGSDEPSLASTGISLVGRCTYEDVCNYMDWTTRSKSPFVSTSFSFGWALWEAIRRYRQNVKHDVEIAVIDATQLVHKSVTAVALMQKGAEQQHESHSKWLRYAEESQLALVYGHIPTTAVITSISLRQIIPELPSYFIKSPSPLHSRSRSCLDRLAWSPALGQRLSYRQFCLDMSRRYFDLPLDHRLRDATVGSVRLAMRFFRSWFDNHLADAEFDTAVERVTRMAWGIANWPDAQCGNMTELGVAIASMVRVLAEEARHKTWDAVKTRETELTMIQDVVDELEHVVNAYHDHVESHACSDWEAETPQDFRSEVESLMSSPTMTAVQSAPNSPQPLKISIPRSFSDFGPPDLSPVSPLCLSSFKTPWTSVPSDVVAFPGMTFAEPITIGDETLVEVDELDHDGGKAEDAHSTSSTDSSPVSTPSGSPVFPRFFPRIYQRHSLEYAPTLGKTIHDLTASEQMHLLDSIDINLPGPSSKAPASSAESPEHPPITLKKELPGELRLDAEDDVSELSLQSSLSETSTVSYLVSGFLVGAFIAMCVVRGQQRILLIAT